jgi:alanine racemase
MDNITVDLGPDASALGLLGRRAVLIGADEEERVIAEELAGRLGTINYEVTCGLTARVPRANHRDGVGVASALDGHALPREAGGR